MKAFAALLVGLSLTCLAACDRGDQAYAGPPGPLARVFIDSAGAVTLNAVAVDSATLGDSLRVLASLNGGVVYSRANGDRDPSALQEPAMQRVMGEILRNKLPVRLVRPESLTIVGK